MFRDACHSSWQELRSSPIFGCICPSNMQKKQQCDKIFRNVNGNPCIGEYTSPAFFEIYFADFRRRFFSLGCLLAAFVGKYQFWIDFTSNGGHLATLLLTEPNVLTICYFLSTFLGSFQIYILCSLLFIRVFQFSKFVGKNYAV